MTRGGHDLGGLKGLGPISPEAESTEPVFHADWEKRIFALTLAVGLWARGILMNPAMGVSDKAATIIFATVIMKTSWLG